MSRSLVKRSENAVTAAGTAASFASAIVQVQSVVDGMVGAMTPDDMSIEVDTDSNGVTRYRFRAYKHKPPPEDRRR